jgi:hypothetical protein
MERVHFVEARVDDVDDVVDGDGCLGDIGSEHHLRYKGEGIEPVWERGVGEWGGIVGRQGWIDDVDDVIDGDGSLADVCTEHHL